MSINIPLKIDRENDSQKNGFVGFDENEIYGVENSGAYSTERNGARSKSLFDNVYTNATPLSIANKIHSGKNELQVPFDTPRLGLIQEALLVNNSIDIKSLNNAKANLGDDTKELINKGIGEGLEVGLLDSFNPDFTANSVNFIYSSVIIESDNEDGVNFTHKSPSASYASHPNPEARKSYTAPYKSETSNGGFGNSPLENSVGASTLDSFLFTEKYK